MKLLGQYILREYLKFFSACLLSLVFIAIVFAAIPELDNLEKENGVALFFDSILSGIPLLIEIITPISVLLATILTFLSLRRSSEIVAMSAAGFGHVGMVSPILLFGLLICCLTYLNQSYLAPYWGADERTSVVKQRKSISEWRFFKGELFYFKGISLKSKEVAENQIFHFKADHQISQVHRNRNLQLNQGSWVSRLLSERLSIQGDRLTRQSSDFTVVEQDQYPVVFKEELPYPKYTSFPELIREILIKRESAVNYENDLFALYQKIAGFFAIFIMILLALPFSLFSQKESKIRAGIVTAVVLGLAYFLVDQVFLSMSQSSTVSVEVSAFGANVVFATLAICLIQLKRV